MQSAGYYASNSTEEGILRGKLAIVNEGIQFILGQIVAGIRYFSPHLQSSIDDFEEFVMNYVHDTNQRDADNYINDIYHDDSDVSDFDEEEYDSDVQ